MMWAVGPLSLWWYSALGVGSQQSFTLAIIRSTSVSCQKSMHQQEGFNLQGFPPRLPFSSTGHLVHQLQCMGIGHEPVWLSHAPHCFLIHNKLTNIEDGWSRWALALPSHLDIPLPHSDKMLGQGPSHALHP